MSVVVLRQMADGDVCGEGVGWVGGGVGAVGEAQVNRFARWADQTGQAADWIGGEGR
jgi:hypothetical protein